MRIIYIMGKSASGKDTIFNILKKELNVNSYVLYTTRPIRSGEVEGINYNYLTNEQMKEYTTGNKKDKLIEARTYQTVYGPWIYATILDEQFNSNKDLIIVGTLESYNAMRKYFKEEMIPIYIEINDGIRLQRALNRELEQKEPKYTELCRRFIADNKDFSEENLKGAGVEKRFVNLDLKECVKEIKEYLKTK